MLTQSAKQWAMLVQGRLATMHIAASLPKERGDSCQTKVLIRSVTDAIRLNWEAAEYVWTTPDKARTYKLLPGFDLVLRAFF